MQCIKNTSREKTSELMSVCDFAIATGGAALVKVVYEAGKPCHTVGAGNVVSIVDETADPAAAAKKIAKSKTANNSASCSSENAVALHESIYDCDDRGPSGRGRLPVRYRRAREAPPR